jgi:hypothetical protein
MLDIIEHMRRLLVDPKIFFDSVKAEGWKSPFIFFLWVTSIISVMTPIVNYFGIESTDFSSSYQAQIIAYRIVKTNLLQNYGPIAYIFEIMLIFAFAIPILLFLTVFLHLIYRLIGGQGSVMNAWKAACYGVGPCLLGGFLPYVSLFAAFYSFAMQFYVGPKELYKAKEGWAIVVFVALIALAFIEMFVLGSTVGF